MAKKFCRLRETVDIFFVEICSVFEELWNRYFIYETFRDYRAFCWGKSGVAASFLDIVRANFRA